MERLKIAIIYLSSAFGSVIDRFFFPIGKFKISKAKAIRIIPEIDTISADSFGRTIQLRIAPATGIKNFQILSSETLSCAATEAAPPNVATIRIASINRRPLFFNISFLAP